MQVVISMALVLALTTTGVMRGEAAACTSVRVCRYPMTMSAVGFCCSLVCFSSLLILPCFLSVCVQLLPVHAVYCRLSSRCSNVCHPCVGPFDLMDASIDIGMPLCEQVAAGDEHTGTLLSKRKESRKRARARARNYTGTCVRVVDTSR